MPEEICYIEQIQESMPLSFLSVKGSRELVFNHRVFDDPEFILRFGLDNTRYNGSVRAAVRSICLRCDLCQSSVRDEVSSGGGFRILRSGYVGGEDLDVIGGVERVEFGEEVEGVLALVEDDKMSADSLGRLFAGKGYKVFAFIPRKGTMKGDDRLRNAALAKEILGVSPFAVVCDKGLGMNYSGIDVIDFIRNGNSDVFTIMLTGEPETRETHRRAHGYFEKPVRFGFLYDEVERSKVDRSLWGDD